ncbi:MAG: hypothetical protein KC766_00445 [Myxococcales bacterium]|nr:hypothetical protein [Myxococcales bacterium]
MPLLALDDHGAFQSCLHTSRGSLRGSTQPGRAIPALHYEAGHSQRAARYEGEQRRLPLTLGGDLLDTAIGDDDHCV